MATNLCYIPVWGPFCIQTSLGKHRLYWSTDSCQGHYFHFAFWIYIPEYLSIMSELVSVVTFVSIIITVTVSNSLSMLPWLLTVFFFFFVFFLFLFVCVCVCVCVCDYCIVTVAPVSLTLPKFVCWPHCHSWLYQKKEKKHFKQSSVV